MDYDVALSFAGEDREYVKAVAFELIKLDVKVFYDDFEMVKLWGKDLYTHLQDIYQKQAHYTVIFISKHYAAKLWTNHELKMAQARAFAESRDYILPARFDNTEIQGIAPTIGYINLSKFSPIEFANLVKQKVTPPKPIRKTGLYSSNVPYNASMMVPKHNLELFDSINDELQTDIEQLDEPIKIQLAIQESRSTKVIKEIYERQHKSCKFVYKEMKLIVAANSLKETGVSDEAILMLKFVTGNYTLFCHEFSLKSGNDDSIVLAAEFVVFDKDYNTIETTYLFSSSTGDSLIVFFSDPLPPNSGPYTMRCKSSVRNFIADRRLSLRSFRSEGNIPRVELILLVPTEYGRITLSGNRGTRMKASNLAALNSDIRYRALGWMATNVSPEEEVVAYIHDL